MIRYIVERPWLFVVAAFVVLVSVWTAFITIAVKNGPLPLPLETATVGTHAGH